MTTLLSTTYFGPVQWYQKLHRSERVLIEKHESFVKQTYRNRCVIATANGAQTLSLPTCHRKDITLRSKGDEDSCLSSPFTDTTSSHRGERGGLLITSTLVSNHGNWQHQHWNAIASAYGESAFFDYYADDLRPFFSGQWPSLFEFNMAITRKMCELLDICPNIEYTSEYIPAEKLAADGSITDLREAIRPKNPLPDDAFHPKEYYQVYGSRHGFLPNMSILDLLLNMGNEAIFYL